MKQYANEQWRNARNKKKLSINDFLPIKLQSLIDKIHIINMSTIGSLYNPQIPIIKNFHPTKLLEPIYIKNQNR